MGFIILFRQTGEDGSRKPVAGRLMLVRLRNCFSFGYGLEASE
jgi:hypothetical protein